MFTFNCVIWYTEKEMEDYKIMTLEQHACRKLS